MKKKLMGRILSLFFAVLIVGGGMCSLPAWADEAEQRIDYGAGCVLAPALGQAALPLQRRVVVAVLQRMLGLDARIET
ncbi:MAG: hypothetical protein RSC76_06305, partial [Oscillospiraceae bacterium]